MGLCFSNTIKNPRRYHYMKEPMNPDNHLKFIVTITNIKLRNVPTESSFIKIEFGNYKELQTSKILTNTQNYRFDFHEEFEYVTKSQDLYNTDLKMTLCNKDSKAIGHALINLYDIAIGPQRNNHTLRYSNSAIGRIIFDCKMSQIIKVTIRPEIIVCQLLESPKEKEYNFSLRLTTNNMEYLSEHSESFKNLLWADKKLNAASSELTTSQSFNLTTPAIVFDIQRNSSPSNHMITTTQNPRMESPKMLRSFINEKFPEALSTSQLLTQVDEDQSNYSIDMNEDKRLKNILILDGTPYKAKYLKSKSIKDSGYTGDSQLSNYELLRTLSNRVPKLKISQVFLSSNGLMSDDTTRIKGPKFQIDSLHFGKYAHCDEEIYCRQKSNKSRTIMTSKHLYQKLNMSSPTKQFKKVINTSSNVTNKNYTNINNALSFASHSISQFDPIAQDNIMPELNLSKSLSNTYNTTIYNLKKRINWNYTLSGDEPPILDVELNILDITTYSFQFFLWSINDKESTLSNRVIDIGTDDSHVYIDHKLIGECYINLYKIYSEDDMEADQVHQKGLSLLDNPNNRPDDYDDEANRPYHNHHQHHRRQSYGNSQQLQQQYQQQQQEINHSRYFTEKLWHHGICVGTLKGQFYIINEVFYRQMLCGVLSDNGPIKSIQVILKQPKSMFLVFGNTIPKEVKALSTIKDHLHDYVFKLAKEKDMKMQKKIIDEMARGLLQITVLLKISHKESSVSYVYYSEDDLYATQKILIDLAIHLLNYCDEAPATHKPIYFQCLKLLIINRSEFNLDYMGFNNTSTCNINSHSKQDNNDILDYTQSFLENTKQATLKSKVLKSQIVPNLKKKLKVCLSYQNMLYHTLQKVLNKLTQKKLDEIEREFVEQFCAIAYFRIPQFREKLLGCLIKSCDEEKLNIEESRGIDWNINDLMRNVNKTQDNISYFDWDKDFYRFLKDTTKGEHNFKFLEKILSNEEWQRRITKRGIAFCFFLNEWAKHVHKTVIFKDQVPWEDLPGYNILIRAFLIELKKKEIKRYPEALVMASNSLLYNERLLSVFVTILYQKTSVYDSMAIFAVFNRINEWFQILIRNKKKIPATFDNLFFVKGIIMIFEGEHALNIAKVLWLIYNNFRLFNIEVRRHLCEYMLNEGFYKLFLSWSWNVRQVFQNLLLYRIYHIHRKIMTDAKSLTEVKHALHLAYKKDQHLNNNIQHESIINDLINLEYHRNINYMERIRIKIEKEKEFLNIQRRYDQRKVSNKQVLNKQTQSVNELDSNSEPLSKANHFSARNPNSTFEPQHTTTDDVGTNDLSVIKLKVPNRISPRNHNNSPGLNDFKMYSSLSNIGSFSKLNQPSRHSNSVDYGNPQDHQLTSSLGNMEEMKLTLTNNDINNNTTTINNNNNKDNINTPSLTRKYSIQDFEATKRQILQGNSGYKPKVVINRKFYLSKDTSQQNKYFKDETISKNLEVYLLRGCQEFARTKLVYTKWANEILNENSHLSESEQYEKSLEARVPEIQIKIPRDDSESNRIELDDEW